MRQYRQLHFPNTAGMRVRDFRTSANLSSALCDGNLPLMADTQVTRYYDEFDEDSRLTTAFGQLEFARTMELLLRYLPPPPALVLDIGGGTGPYSEALGQRGY
jgi:hypothetical protein